MKDKLIGAIKTLAITVVASFVLLVSTTLISYMNYDPDSLLPFLSIAVLAAGALICGILSERFIAEAPIISGIIGAVIYLLMIFISAPFFRDGEIFHTVKILLGIAVVFVASIVGALIARPRAVDFTKTRKLARKKFKK